METLENLISLWPSVKPILLPYEGAASQVYVLDVPQSELERVIDVYCRRAKHASITMLDGYGFKEDEARECDITNRVDILKASGQSIISATFTKERYIQFWIWPNKRTGTFDAEFVFFGNDFFKENVSDKGLMKSFNLIYSLAEMVRENSQKSECVLSGSEVGDPREERHESWTVFW